MEDRKIVVLYVSRNKDNKHLDGFRERRVSKYMNDNPERILRDFEDFVRHGIDGEMCRCYISCATRNEEKVQKKLMHELIEGHIDLSKIESKIASCAMQADCAKEKLWLFDFDIDNKELLDEFIRDIHSINPLMTVKYSKTPNGYAVVTCGFDCRRLLEKWGENVELKKDGMLIVKWSVKE